MHARDRLHHLVQIGGTHGLDVCRCDDRGHRGRPADRLARAGGNADHGLVAIGLCQLIFVVTGRVSRCHPRDAKQGAAQCGCDGTRVASRFKTVGNHDAMQSTFSIQKV